MAKPEQKAPKGTVKKVLRLLRPHGAALICSLLLAVANVACTLMIPMIFGYAIDLITGPGTVDFAGNY